MIFYTQIQDFETIVFHAANSGLGFCLAPASKSTRTQSLLRPRELARISAVYPTCVFGTFRNRTSPARTSTAGYNGEFKVAGEFSVARREFATTHLRQGESQVNRGN